MLKIIISISMFLIFLTTSLLSFAENSDDIGQTIQINTRLHSYVGKPSWLLIIRDIDHNENIPYLFDFKKGENFWVAITGGRNYLITVSTLQFSPYRRNPFRSKKIKNFCQLESQGRIIHDKSFYITISGDLTPNTNSFRCDISSYIDPHFTIAAPGSEE